MNFFKFKHPAAKASRECTLKPGWSSGMIPALGAGGLQFNPGFRPFFYVAPLPTFKGERKETESGRSLYTFASRKSQEAELCFTTNSATIWAIASRGKPQNGAPRLQLTSAEYKPDDPNPLVDESEPPTSIADVEKPPPADAEFTAAEIRSLFMEVVLQPIFLDRALLAMSQDDDGKWRCPRCQELYGHDPESQEHDHGSRTHLERHTFIPNIQTGKILSSKCLLPTATYSNALLMTVTSRQRQKPSFAPTALSASHTTKYRARRGIKSHQITSTQITQRATRRVEGYTQLLMEVRSIFNDVEDEVNHTHPSLNFILIVFVQSHRARLHANVDSLIGQADTFSTSDKHIPVTMLELLELVEELSDLSEDSD
ncbi:uncharacterized protein LACBIDRAFT_324699 [Laccaria bicolor S238N-H82]|uniref:Predicted protein n=1 Tax=Laccaria bicolor (strain S238N-H82 / ATCC MYA-4686) TaxID=486041 RepID=B0D2R5_LACBS|nr:uncharacterized protein LACBIDRAFT_324699 [Laccaria bicolor S238N-H82]EDR10799.1 predicted protein [Laccaria bicolor S238N-H82]|eukprot:XP_001878100.1 predicted protein [Laccaria bicolor S238N-H82]